MNLYAMLVGALRRFPDKIALSAADRHVTYREMDQAASRVAAYYASLGCVRGDRIVLFSKNSLDYPILLLATFRAGLVAVPVNAKLHPHEAAWICENADARLVLAAAEQIDALRAALDSVSSRHLKAIEDIKPASLPEGPAQVVEVLPEDAAWVFYTSGTTGRPKGAVLTHRNLISATVNCLADMFDFRASDRVLHVAPLSHASGIYLIPSLVRGAENLIADLPRFDPDEVLEIVASQKISVLAFVAPTMIVRLLAAKSRSDISSLRGVIYGGSTIHLEHVRAAVQKFGPIFHQLYGQGEAPMTISYLSAHDHLDASDEVLLSAGYVRSGVEVRILNDNGHPVADGEDGEICVRGDVVMRGYWCNELATARALKGGWLHTGDIGRFGTGGLLRVLDRRDDAIISGGTNIYPKEIEDVIAAHPLVKETIAFGVPDKEWGQSVAVAIVREEQADLTEDEIVSFCAARLGRFKLPRRVIFADDLPKSAYGKVLRRELRARYGDRFDGPKDNVVPQDTTKTQQET